MYVLVFDPSKRKDFQSQVYFAGEKIYPDFSEECSLQYMRMCEQSVLKLLSSTAKKIGMIITSNGVLLMFSTYAYIFKNEIQLPVPLILPFTDLESIDGLIINMLNQAFLASLVVVGNVGIEIATCILNNGVFISASAICHEIDGISQRIREHREWNATAGIDYYFRNIIVQVEDFDRFVNVEFDQHALVYALEYFHFWFLSRGRELFHWRLFLQPILLSIGIAIALFFYLSVSNLRVQANHLRIVIEHIEFDRVFGALALGLHYFPTHNYTSSVSLEMTFLQL